MVIKCSPQQLTMKCHYLNQKYLVLHGDGLGTHSLDFFTSLLSFCIFYYVLSNNYSRIADIPRLLVLNQQLTHLPSLLTHSLTHSLEVDGHFQWNFLIQPIKPIVIVKPMYKLAK
jgi:hypothetical protein